MGWYFDYNIRTKADLVSGLLKCEDELPGENIAHRVIGNNLWIVRQFGSIEGDRAHYSGKRMIQLSLLGYDRREKCWGHKDMIETCGPGESNCPLAFLDLATDFAEEGWSKDWRARVRAYHARKKALASVEIAPSQRITLGGSVYTLLHPYSRAKGFWVIRREGDNATFKVRVGQIRRALQAASQAIRRALQAASQAA